MDPVLSRYGLRMKLALSPLSDGKRDDRQVATPWGETLTWSEECISSSELQEFVQQGDSLCDAAVTELYDSLSHPSSPHQDPLHSLLSSSHPSCVSFLGTVTRCPPTRISASPSQLHRARDFFASYSVPILLSLLHVSLACGLASPQISRTLRQVSHLAPPSSCPMIATGNNARIVRRLLETVQFVIDVCGEHSSAPNDDLANPEGDEAWQSTIRVRMLHAFARRKASNRHKFPAGVGGEGQCPFQSHAAAAGDGEVAINQAEMAVTLASFCVAPLLGLEKMGFVLSHSQKEDFVALWRHYGWFLGISETILEKYFGTFARAQAFMFSVATLIMDDEKDGNSLPAPVYRILQAFSNNGRLPYFSIESSCALTRHLCGDHMSDRLQLPQPSLIAHWKMRLGLLAINAPIYLGEHVYGFSGWNEHRKSLMRAFNPISIAGALDWQRTLFAPYPGNTTIHTYVDASVPKSSMTLLLLRFIILHLELFFIILLPLTILLSPFFLPHSTFLAMYLPSSRLVQSVVRASQVALL